jgi:uncharacterized protein
MNTSADSLNLANLSSETVPMSSAASGLASSACHVLDSGKPMAPELDRIERIHSLDVIRGLALLGMIVVHFHVRSSELGGLDDVIRTFIWRFIENKSHGTFGLLFGVGFAIQLRRAGARGLPFTRMYLRRLAALGVFGFLAHACFGFNVLLGYAAWAIPLLLIRRWSTRALIVAAIFSAASLSIYRGVSAWYDLATLGSDGALAAARADQSVSDGVTGALQTAVAHDSYPQLLAARLRHMAWFYTQPFSFMPGTTLALFIVGLLAVRHRLFEHPRAHRRVLLAMMAFGVLSWIADNWLLPLWTVSNSMPDSSRPLRNLLGLFQDQWLTFTYVGGAVLLLDRHPEWLSHLRPIARAGRMALTNYLIQIAMLDLLFAGYALHLGEIRPRFVPLAAGLLFTAEIVFSKVWLEHYRFGPAEWIWRSVTYGHAQPMRR